MKLLKLPVKLQLKHLLFLLILVLLGLAYLYREPLFSYIQERLTTIEIRQRVVSEETAVISVVETASPAVVSVVEEQTINSPFFGTQTDKQGIGTGFIIRENGLILTNRHVVSDTSAKYFVVTNEGTEYAVKEIHRDSVLDLAILKVDATNLPTVALGDSDALKIGQTVVAIGNALGRFSNTVTKGVVSGIGRGITASSGLGESEELENVIQTDAAINPGNSGGPLLNLSAEVVGINVATASGAENIGFSLPINLIKPVVEGFEREGRIIRPFLGINYTLIGKDVAKVQNLVEGAYVRSVVAGSGAAKAGVKIGDIITKIDGELVSETNTVAKIILGYKVGDKVKLAIRRDGRTLELTATLGEAPTQ
ncbi:MAG: trypsin-like peptidase domain-containing protein [Patescibacteria group bacterium]